MSVCQGENTAYTGVNGRRDGCGEHQLGWYRRVFGPFVGTKARRLFVFGFYSPENHYSPFPSQGRRREGTEQIAASGN